MIKNYLIKHLQNIENDSTIAIFGANEYGIMMKKDISEVRPDIKITCFIDNNIKGNIEGLPAYSFFDIKNGKNLPENQFKSVLLSTKTDSHITSNILNCLGIEIIPISHILFYLYRHPLIPDNQYYKLC